VSRAVWDASALLLLLNAEPGAERLAGELGEALISAVNLSEVVAKLADAGVPEDDLREALAALPLEVVPFDEALAYVAGLLRPSTRAQGLSMGDRACLGLALATGLPVITADRAWRKLDLGIEVRTLR
jgi:PIN domain nuclease of toxin-antitoxin system